ncbi:MAG: ribosome maturation factor RimM [Thermodesulfobacteriota bacterium]
METILIGKIVGVHAIKGELKLLTYGEIDWLVGESVFLTKKGEKPASQVAPCKILSMRPHKGKGVWLATLEGISTIDEAEPLKGMDLYVDKALLPEPAPNEYYLKDILGISVFTEDGKELGRLTEIISTGANDVYQVEGPEGELLLPALSEVILSVDLAEAKMIVRLPEGL